jgi:cytoplasmic iron level regulating protein YaaA (DUF328/UPF0246 family)
MLILLPPSETKRQGGHGAPLDMTALRLPALRERRHEAVAALVSLSHDEEAAARVLKLSARQRGEVAVNARIGASPTMPAMDRYTGVLYDALDASALDDAARSWLAAHVMIQTAPLGPVGAADPIPAYRLAAGAALPGVAPLRRFWADAVTEALRESGAGFVLDLRSKAYVELGPVPAGLEQAYVSVVARSADGGVRALNHFNKRAKGLFVRLLAERRPAATTIAGLLEWAGTGDVPLHRGEHAGELLLVADEQRLGG